MKRKRFSIDWPPGFVPQPYKPPLVRSNAQIEAFKRGKKVTDLIAKRKRV